MFNTAGLLKRSVRDGNLLVIGLALVIAVASVTAVDTFTDRVRRAMERQANALLAADLVISSSHAMPQDYQQLAVQTSLASAETTSMRSVVSHGDNLQLIELKAVSEGYPLRGELITKQDGQIVIANESPAPGTVWVEQRLLNLLGIAEYDEISVGALTLVVDRVIELEPDRAGSVFNLAPRVMMNIKDLPATELLLPGSRVTHRLLLAGDEADIDDFRQQLVLRDTDRIRSPEEARPEVSSAIDRADHFLDLAVLTAIILSAVAIALAARAYSAKNAKSCALLRVLGATRSQVRWYFGKELASLSVISIALGVALGLLTQQAIALMIVEWVQGDLPQAKLAGTLRGIFVGAVATFGFALPYLLQLPNTPPALVLRPSLQTQTVNPKLLITLATVAGLVIVPWDPKAWQITLSVMLGIIFAIVFLASFGQLLLAILYRMRKHFGLALKFGIINLWRRKVLSQIQIAGIALGLTALFTLGLIRTELLDSWLAQLPDSAPNRFLINIQPDELEPLRQFFRDEGLSETSFYPMTRARLVSINGNAVEVDSYRDPRAQRLANREFNLSWSARLKPDNRLVAGNYWQADSKKHEFSFEQDIAKTLGLQVGDIIEFAAAGENLSGKITNVRTVQWETMGVNFFVEGTPALLQDYPATFITSFYLPSEKDHTMPDLVRQFPSVTVLDVSALIAQVKMIMNRASDAIEFVAIFTLLAGLLVLISAIQTTQQERTLSTAVLKTFGGTKLKTLGVLASEFVLIGLLAGVTAATTAQLCTWLIAERVLKVSFQFSFSLLATGAGAASLAVLAIGLLAITFSFRKPTRLLLSTG